MYKVAWFCVLFTGMVLGVRAQVDNATDHCAAGKKELYRAMAKNTVATPEEDQYDVKYVKLDISLSNQTTEISGNVITNAVVTATSMQAYFFELEDILTIDSVKIDGQITTVTHSGAVHKADLPAALAQGADFTAQVFYHGVAEAGNIFGFSGLNNDTAWGTQVTYTLSEPYKARKWWPCKQSLLDKIDSADIWITVPEGLKAGSNGLLQTTNPMPGGGRRYQWKTSYPIAYYLISAAVAPYNEYSFYAKLSATDSVLIQNFIYKDPVFLSQSRGAMDSLAVMIQFLSELFGEYPFKKEKYGHCIVPFFGGMEHQTMTTQGDFGSNLTIHEMGHQWFGNHVTCATWKDIWLNEGFASYIEYLYNERYRSAAQAVDKMEQFWQKALDAPYASIYVDDTTRSERIFDGALSYAKAAAVIHTLRFVINDDFLFFHLLRAYQQRYAFGHARTEDFMYLTEDITGMDWGAFFEQWIYKQGYPILDVSWNQVFEKVFVKIKQRGAAPLSNNLFRTPLELKLLSFNGNDTVIRVEMDEETEWYDISWTGRMSGISVDPDNKVLHKTEQLKKDPELGLNAVNSDELVAFPSSTSGDWYIVGMKDSYSMVLTDMNGSIVWKGGNGTQTGIKIPSGSLASGMYFLRLYWVNELRHTFKLVKE